MLKRIIQTSFFLLFVISTYSQSTYAPVGSNWKQRNWVEDGNQNLETCETTDCTENFTHFVTTSIIKVTETECSLIEVFKGSKDNLVSTGDSIIVKEVDNRIFFLHDNQFYLMLDFNLNAGDTMTFYAPNNFREFALRSYDLTDPSLNSIYKSRAVIESTEIINIDGQDRKLMHFDKNYFNEQDSVLLFDALEGVGNLSGFFGEPGIFVAGGCHGRFICYEDNVFKYTDIEDCDCIFPEMTTSNNNYLNNNISIYPNPVDDILTISTEGDIQIQDYKIFDINGRLISVQHNKSIFSTSELDSGVYFIDINTLQGSVRKRFFKL
ncbi:MAG: T9SS type A sorting domain-containing protein [Saprospiraceae bacterium]|nr:T9SS type A sorting domain-containing protein [Bacteroidia bacterium]NNE15015.1 T9SS type A sorting domain-containing protein [Saprospiraceae bacterium]NNL92150.1 T9SS type A sorting domain-containing protein [Saprospiraceae bacterium]